MRIQDKRGNYYDVNITKYDSSHDEWIKDNVGPEALNKIKHLSSLYKVPNYSKLITPSRDETYMEPPKDESDSEIYGSSLGSRWRRTWNPSGSFRTPVVRQVIQLESGFMKTFLEMAKMVHDVSYKAYGAISGGGSYVPSSGFDEALDIVNKRIEEDFGGEDLLTGIGELVPEFLALGTAEKVVVKAFPFLKAKVSTKLATRLVQAAKANEPAGIVMKGVAKLIVPEVIKGAARGGIVGAGYGGLKEGTLEGAGAEADQWALLGGVLGGVGAAWGATKLPGYQVWKAGMKNPEVRRIMGELEALPGITDEHMVSMVSLDVANAKRAAKAAKAPVDKFLIDRLKTRKFNLIDDLEKGEDVTSQFPEYVYPQENVPDMMADKYKPLDLAKRYERGSTSPEPADFPRRAPATKVPIGKKYQRPTVVGLREYAQYGVKSNAVPEISGGSKDIPYNKFNEVPPWEMSSDELVSKFHNGYTGIEPAIVDNNGVMHMASDGGHYETYQRLLKKGKVSPNISNEDLNNTFGFAFGRDPKTFINIDAIDATAAKVQEHKAFVKGALERGERVPRKAIEEYPELLNEYSSQVDHNIPDYGVDTSIRPDVPEYTGKIDRYRMGDATMAPTYGVENPELTAELQAIEEYKKSGSKIPKLKINPILSTKKPIISIDGEPITQIGTNVSYSTPFMEAYAAENVKLMAKIVKFIPPKSTWKWMKEDVSVFRSIVKNHEAIGKFKMSDGGTLGEWLKKDILHKPGRASVQFTHGQTIINAFKETNIADLTHEMAHIWRRELPPGTMKLAEKMLGVKDGIWTEAAEEAFANQFEHWLAKGSSGNSYKDYVFNKYKEWMNDVYREIKNSPLKERVNPGLSKIFDSMTKGGSPLPKIVAASYLQKDKKEQIDEFLRNVMGFTEEMRGSTSDILNMAKEGNLQSTWDALRQRHGDDAIGKIMDFMKKVDSEIFSNIAILRDLPNGEKLYETAELNLGSGKKGFTLGYKLLEKAFAPIKYETELIEGQTAREYATNVASSIRAYFLDKRNIPMPDEMKMGYDQYLHSFAQLRHTNPDLWSRVNQTVLGLDNASNGIIKYWRGKRIISNFEANAMKLLNPFHVPHNKVIDRVENVVHEGSYATVSGGFKRISGSDKEIMDPVVAILQNYMRMIPKADEHVLRRKVIQAMVSDPYWRKRVAEITVDDLPKVTKTKWADVAEHKRIDPDGQELVVSMFSPNVEMKDNWISYKENGRWRIFEIGPEDYTSQDKLIVNALRKTTFEKLGQKLVNETAFGILGKFKELKHTGVILNPVFTVKNAFRDAVTSVVNDPNISGGFGFYRDFLKATFSDSGYFKTYAKVVAGMEGKSTFWDKLAVNGAFGSEFTRNNIPAAENAIKSMFEDKSKLNFWLDWKHPVEAMQKFNNLVEAVPRYRAAYQEYLTNLNTLGDKEAMRRATLVYRRITADFAERGGGAIRTYGGMVPFLTAQFAGMRAEIKAFMRNPKDFMGKVTQLIAIPTTLVWLMNRDEDWYNKIPPIERNLYWFLTPHIRIPKPYGITGMIAGSGIENLLNHANGTNPNLAENIIVSLKSSLPAGASPPWWSAYQGYKNEINPFFNSKIQPEFSEKWPTWAKSRPSTTDAAKVIPKILMTSKGNMSPAMIDFLASELVGTLGSMGMRGASALMRAGQSATGHKQVTGATNISNIIPIFTNDQNKRLQTRQMSELYDALTESESVRNVLVGSISKTQDITPRMIKIAERDKWKVDAFTYLNRYTGEIAKLRKQYQMIARPSFAPEGMTTAKKQKMLDDLAVKMTDLADEALAIYRKQEKEANK